VAGTLVEVARCGTTSLQPPGRPGVRTHQLVLAVLGAAQHGGTHRAIAAELARALTRRDEYRGSTEELTPSRGDPVTLGAPALAIAAMLCWPPAGRRLTFGGVGANALTPAAWQLIIDQARSS
jgi:hypothetical protein